MFAFAKVGCEKVMSIVFFSVTYAIHRHLKPSANTLLERSHASTWKISTFNHRCLLVYLFTLHKIFVLFLACFSVGCKMLDLKDLSIIIIVSSLIAWWIKKPILDLAALLPGYSFNTCISFLYKFIGINFEGLFCSE